LMCNECEQQLTIEILDDNLHLGYGSTQSSLNLDPNLLQRHPPFLTVVFTSS